MLFRKFYSPGEFEGATLADFKVIDRSAAPAPQVAETAPEPPAAAPEPAVETVPAPAAPPPPVPPAPPVTEPAVPQAEPIRAAAPEVKTEPAPTKTWEEVMKDNGFDDFDIGLLKYRKQTGDVTEYLQHMSVDYKSMTPEEVMRRDLREKYPKLSEDAFKKLERREVIDKYNLDSDVHDEVDIEVGKAMLERDAEVKRGQFLERQAKFTQPQRDPNGEAQRQQEEQARVQQQQAEAFRQSVTTNAATQSLLTSKRLVLDGGEEGMQFNYEAVNPNEYVDMILDPQKYQEAISTKDAQGNLVPDVQKLLKAAAWLKHEKDITKALINYGESRGTKKLIDKELVNASPSPGVTPAPQEETLGQAFLARGRRSWQT